ncbi:MAG: bifunctional protein FolD [Ignavibacteriaceae bacterium]|nr:MAG: bifunctional protein FolD [Ignavibacteriaceae bacterium]
MKLIDGKQVAADIKAELKEEIAELQARTGRVPGLVVIIVGNNPASEVYVRNKHKACGEAGINSIVLNLPEETTQADLLEKVEYYNNDPETHGILVQLPLPKQINEDVIIRAIDPKKDVDGFHPTTVGEMVTGNPTFLPCTPAGVVELLKRYDIDPAGKHVVVVGRSNIVGKPAALLLMQKKKFANAIVTVCHSAAKDISVFTKQADILIAAMGVPRFIRKEMVKEGVVVIDVGTNRIDDPTSKTGTRLVGDVDFDEVAPLASYITPVPGGVGPMTIAMLLKNTVKAFKDSGI